ncbi:methylated-DNA--[protein]-cysteine S-methyltransferase [Sphingomonas sp. Leaf205]
MYARDAASIATPIGLVRVTGTGDRIDAIDIGVESGSTSDAPAILEALRQLEAYFAGRLAVFDLPLALSPIPRGADLRQAIVDIAYGTTASYGALAKAIGSSPRAIG